MLVNQRSVMIFCKSGVSFDQKAWLISGMYCPTHWWSWYEYRTPASHNLAMAQLSLVEMKPSNVPCDSARGTSGQAMVLGTPPQKAMRQLVPAPPGLRIFRPLMSSMPLSGFLVVYQFCNPRSIHGPTILTRSLVS